LKRKNGGNFAKIAKFKLGPIWSHRVWKWMCGMSQNVGGVVDHFSAAGLQGE
jgi:hypothetical protein